MIAGTKRTRGVAALLVAAVGVVMTVLAAVLELSNRSVRWPGNPWTTSQSVTMTAGVLSCLSLVCIGAWLGWRLERNPIGWWLNAAGIALAAWFAALFWEHRAGTWFGLVLPAAFRILVVLAVLAWPTGRFERRWHRPLVIALTVYAASSILTGFVGEIPQADAPWGRPDWLLPSIGGPELGALRQAVFGIGFLAVAPTAFIVAVGRRRARLPVGLRAVSTPAFVAAWVLAAADYWLFVSNVLGAQLEFFADGGTTAIGTVRAVVDYGRFGMVPLLLLIGARSRRRIVTAGADRPGTVDLGDAADEHTLDDRVQALLGIESARVVFPGQGDGWLAGDGTTVAADEQRRRVVFSDVSGNVLAGLDLPDGAGVAPTTVEAVAATVRVDLVRARRTAEATARLVELRELQRTVLDRQDAARRRLERDLHDGVQQRLVALSLDAAMAERRARRNPGGVDGPLRKELVSSLRATVDDVRHLVDQERPAVLDGGLAAGLAALTASAPIPVELTVRGDLGADDPMARVLWFAASEAVGNALKHAGARRLSISLQVGREDTVLTVSDDGRGGVTAVPGAIRARIEPTTGSVVVSSPVDGGTSLTISVPRSELVVS